MPDLIRPLIPCFVEFVSDGFGLFVELAQAFAYLLPCQVRAGIYRVALPGDSL